MFIEPDKMLENCPKEIEEDINDIVDLSEDFLDEVDIFPHQNINEIKVDLQEAKNYLFLIINRFVTLINESFIEKEGDEMSIALKIKFDEDIGAIMGDLKKKPADKLGGPIGITSLLRFAGDLKTTFDFLIYNPITRINKKEFKDINKYFSDMFEIIRASASTLGYESKPIIPLSKRLLPKPEDTIAKSLGGIGKSKEKSMGDEDALNKLGEWEPEEEDEEEEEDEGDEGDEGEEEEEGEE